MGALSRELCSPFYYLGSNIPSITYTLHASGGRIQSSGTSWCNWVRGRWLDGPGNWRLQPDANANGGSWGIGLATHAGRLAVHLGLGLRDGVER